MPVIAVAWQYTGLPADQMAGRISTLFQRTLINEELITRDWQAHDDPGLYAYSPRGLP